MKFRTKIYLFFILVALLNVIIALSIDYFQARRQLLRQVSSKLQSIVATTATQIDGNLLKNIKTPEDVTSPEFLQVQGLLRKIRAANQRSDVFVRYMYIIKPSVRHSGMMETVVDASTEPESVSLPGELMPDAMVNDLLEHLSSNYAPLNFVRDRWGYWLAAYAPIYDSNNKYVATLGADLYAKRVTQQLQVLLIDGGIALLAALVLALILAQILSHTVTRSLRILCNSVGEIGKGNLDLEIKMKTADEFQELGTAINDMCRGLREKERLKKSFSRYVSEYVLEKIVNSDTPLKLVGERKKITVLFSDLRHFTTLAERLPPEEVVGILNEYFDAMLGVIFKNNGTLDKFIGDGIMVEFGSPLEDKHQEKNAVTCALEMQHALYELSEQWSKIGKPALSMGIGIHTGDAIVGNIGSLLRMEYTAIGDTVNVASRIERETKRLECQILVSEATWSSIKDEFEGKSLGEVTLPGRLGKIIIYTVTSKKT